jgi:probable HAF family extracellular repeat protein
MVDLGMLAGGTGGSAATAINASGQVVGSSSVAGGNVHAFIYSGGVMTDLGTLPGATSSYATAINASGQVAGWGPTGTGIYHPFLSSGGTMTDLGVPSGAYSGQAFGLNNSATVVGWGSLSGTGSYAFVATNGADPVKVGSNIGLMEALAINNVGQVVGYGYGGAYLGATPLSSLVTNLGASDFSSLSVATGISDNGYIVGYGLDLTGQEHAFLLSPVPEPSTWALLASGFLLVAFLWRRRWAAA